MYIIVGLGNPGKEYEGTRHNIGRDILLSLAQEKKELWQISDWQFDKYKNAQVAKFSLADKQVIFMLPETYMNLSGQSLQKITNESPDTQVIVIHDDLDLSFGQIKISFDRGAGGHRGVESIIGQIGKSFIRLRLGIDSEFKNSGADFVLSQFSLIERNQLPDIYLKTQTIISALVSEPLEKVMSEYNSK